MAHLFIQGALFGSMPFTTLVSYQTRNFILPFRIRNFQIRKTGSRNPDFLNSKINVPLPNVKQIISDILQKTHCFHYFWGLQSYSETQGWFIHESLALVSIEKINPEIEAKVLANQAGVLRPPQTLPFRP